MLASVSSPSSTKYYDTLLADIVSAVGFGNGGAHRVLALQINLMSSLTICSHVERLDAWLQQALKIFYGVHIQLVLIQSHARSDVPLLNQVECGVKYQHRSNSTWCGYFGFLYVELVPVPT